jgi:hypothetical protein
MYNSGFTLEILIPSAVSLSRNAVDCECVCVCVCVCEDPYL